MGSTWTLWDMEVGGGGSPASSALSQALTLSCGRSLPGDLQTRYDVIAVKNPETPMWFLFGCDVFPNWGL